jgi:CheY-like chemotaxis protein
MTGGFQEMNAAKIDTGTDDDRGAAFMAPVLVVDDEPAVLRIYGRILESRGVPFVTASSADEALAHLRSGNAFTALLTDVDMPGASGIELASSVRARGLNMPILFLTAVPHATRSFVASDEHAWCLGKPFSPKDLGCLLDQVLRHVPQSSAPPPASYRRPVRS